LILTFKPYPDVRKSQSIAQLESTQFNRRAVNRITTDFAKQEFLHLKGGAAILWLAN